MLWKLPPTNAGANEKLSPQTSCSYDLIEYFNQAT